MDNPNEALWSLLSDEELAEQSDLWRYESERHRSCQRYGLSLWCARLSNAAYESLNRRQAERAAAAARGEQLRFTEREYRRVFEPGA